MSFTWCKRLLLYLALSSACAAQITNPSGRSFNVQTGCTTDAAGSMTCPNVGTFGSMVVGAGTPNEAGTGTTLNKTAYYTGSNTLKIAPTTATAIPVYIVTSGAGTTGNAFVATSGTANCVFDGATTANDFVVQSVTAAGECHDAGATAPTSGWVIGQVLSTNGGGGTYTVALSQGYNATSSGATTRHTTFEMVCQGGVPSHPFSTITGTAVPTAACPTTSNGLAHATLDFAKATPIQVVQGHFPLFSDWGGTMSLDVSWFAAATSGNTEYTLQTACVADGAVFDPTFNAAQLWTSAPAGTTNQAVLSTEASVTLTGCVAPTAGHSLEFFFIFGRNNSGSDTMTGNARVERITFNH